MLLWLFDVFYVSRSNKFLLLKHVVITKCVLILHNSRIPDKSLSESPFPMELRKVNKHSLIAKIQVHIFYNVLNFSLQMGISVNS